MTSTDFEDYKDTYQQEVESAIAFAGQDHAFFTEAKAKHILRLAAKLLTAPSELCLLDVGCGVGSTDRYLVDHFRELHGVDIPPGVIARARQNVPRAHYQTYDGHSLPFDTNTFDIVFAINVMHHVPPAQWPDFTREMARVCRPGGVVMVFEHNPYNPLTRRVVRQCAFDADAVLLPQARTLQLLTEAGLTRTATDYILFFPFRHTLFAHLESGMGWLPLGAQYYAVARKPQTTARP